MTATRVIDSHEELFNSGQLPHSSIDTLLTGSTFLVVSGTGPQPAAARRIAAGSGITITDEGPGGRLIITSAAALTGSSVSWSEVPSGDADGANVSFVLANTPSPSLALMFFVNGVLQRQGADYDYLLSGSTVTTSFIARSGSNVAATYPY